MIGHRIDELFGNLAAERDGAACGRAEVAVAWGLVVALAAAFACLSIVARLPLDTASSVAKPTAVTAREAPGGY